MLILTILQNFVILTIVQNFVKLPYLKVTFLKTSYLSVLGNLKTYHLKTRQVFSNFLQILNLGA